MKAIYAVVLAAGMVGVTVRAEDVATLSLDDVLTVSPRIEADETVKAEGKSSVKITTQWPTTVCLGVCDGLDTEASQLVYSAKVKSELEGNALLEMWAHVDGGQYFSRGMNDTIIQTNDWKTIRTPFMFKEGQKPEKITLNLVINGKGTVWIDDVVLSKEPLK